jgi:CubicO group peptidase (beta-lactamase class C family)
VDVIVTRAMDLAGVPGVAAGVLRSGRAEERFWGVSDARTNAPLTRDSRFEAASLSKPVTAFITLALARRGALDIDQPLTRYGASAVNPSDARGLRVTARHVLAHSSGWRNWRRASDPPLVADFEPGSRYQYSGEGFVQLQRALEHVADRGFAELAAELVFLPLGMSRSTFLVTSADTSLVTGHGARGQPRESYGLRVGRHLEGHAPPGRAASTLRVAEVEALLPTMEPASPAIPAFVMPNAAGSLVTTTGDYLRFWSHLLSATPGSDTTGVLARMMARETPINGELSWGLGIAREELNGELRLWHQGDNPGFKNFLSVTPRLGEAVVVFTNADAGMRVAERAVRALTGHDHGAFAWL